MSKKPRASGHELVEPEACLPLVVFGLLFVSGAAGLIYQVLWMKQLGLLFGNTSQAASATLAAFFAGLAAGSWYFGRKGALVGNPMRLYALLEFGVVVTACVYFGLLEAFYRVLPMVYHSMPGEHGITAIKFVFSLVLIFPPSFCMGGTLPVIGQQWIRTRGVFGKTSSLLYAVNTAGAAAGVLLAVFLLVPSLGFRWSYGVTMGMSLGVALVAWWMSRRAAGDAGGIRPEPVGHDGDGGASQTGGWLLGGLSFLSGFSVLALEVLWTRMFAQVHENSVYSFAVILVVVLVCLAMGAGASSLLSRLKFAPVMMLGILTIAGGVVLSYGPSLMMSVTHQLQPVSSLESWWKYLIGMYSMGFRAVGLAALVMGMVFPYLMKAVERQMVSPARTLGWLLTLNTVGAILGSLVCGFVMLPYLGMWRSMQCIAAAYLLVGICLPLGRGGLSVFSRAMGVTVLVLLFTALDPTRFPAYGVSPHYPDHQVLETWEESDCTVTVVKNDQGHLGIKVNSGYILGTTSAYAAQVNQARIPLYLYPQTESIFFLGMGTGITAGASLDPRYPDVKRVTICELTPAVVEASRKYIPEEMLGGLYHDPRARVLVEDGRHHLQVSDEKYDMINADLFLPYRRGAGSLYSLDHYRTAAKRLTKDGVFVQWLPLYQVTETEFGIIVRTMLEVFPQVTLWRNNFTPGLEQVALIGQNHALPVRESPTADPDEMLAAIDGLNLEGADPSMAKPHPTAMPYYYAGNLNAARALFDSYPINTDDRPLIEYVTPRKFREVAQGDKVIWMVGPRLATMIDRILELCPPDKDPMLSLLSGGDRHLVAAGTAFHWSMVCKEMGDGERGRGYWRAFVEEWTAACVAKKQAR